MKKFLIVKIVLLSILLVIICSILVSNLVFGSKGIFSFNIFNNVTYPNAKEYKILDGNVSFEDENIKNIEINYVGGEINVYETENNSINVYEEFDSDEVNNSDYYAHYLVKNNKLTIQFCKSGKRVKSKISKAKTLNLHFPKISSVSLTINFVSADLNYYGLSNDSTIKNLEISGVSGDSTIENLSADNFKLDSVSGSSTLKNVNINNCKFNMVSGEINISGVVNQNKINTVSGDISLTLKNMPENLDVDGVSAKINISMQDSLDDTGFTLDVDKVSGKVTTNLPVKFEKNRLVYKNGSKKYSIDTVSGDVSIIVLKNS